MTHYINIREELYPLLRMESGYSNSSNKCCSTATETVERTGCKPDDGTQDNGPNKNQEGNDLARVKLQANSENVQGAASVAPKVKGR
jgi:hypothetical protein